MTFQKTSSEESVDPLHGISPIVDSMRRRITYSQGQTIYREFDLAEYWCCIVSGAARKYTLLADGRRRIVDFLLPGDFFGFSVRQRHSFGAEALVSGTTVALYPRRRLEAAGDSDPRIGRQIREIVFQTITRSQARLLTLGRVTSLAKVGSFLTELAQRSTNLADDTVALPMSRYDIADYLALSVETVSRAFTELKRCNAIRCLDNHRIRILDAELLDDGLGRPGLLKATMAWRQSMRSAASGQQRHARADLRERPIRPSSRRPVPVRRAI